MAFQRAPPVERVGARSRARIDLLSRTPQIEIRENVPAAMGAPLRAA